MVKKLIKENVHSYFRVSFRFDGNDGVMQINLVRANSEQEAMDKLKAHKQKRYPDRELEVFGAREVSVDEYLNLRRRSMPVIEDVRRCIFVKENLDSEAQEASFKQGQVFKNSMGQKLVVHNIRKDGTLEIGQIRNYKGEDIVDFVSASTNKSFAKMLKDNGYKLYKDNIKENKGMIKKQIILKEGLEDHDMEWVDEQLEWFSNGNGTFEEFYNFCSEIDCIPDTLQNDMVYNDWMLMKDTIQEMLDNSDALEDFLPVFYNQFNGVDSPEDEYFKVDGYGHFKNWTSEDINLYLDEVREMIQEAKQNTQEY